MGCSGTKEARDETNHADIKTNVANPDGTNVASERTTTQSGYHSDVASGAKHAFTEQLVLPRHCRSCPRPLPRRRYLRSRRCHLRPRRRHRHHRLPPHHRPWPPPPPPPPHHHHHHHRPRQVTNNVHNIEEVYDLTHSTTLGRGACGSVSTCTHKATSMMYAMKTVSIEVSAAD